MSQSSALGSATANSYAVEAQTDQSLSESLLSTKKDAQGLAFASSHGGDVSAATAKFTKDVGDVTSQLGTETDVGTQAHIADYVNSLTNHVQALSQDAEGASDAQAGGGSCSEASPQATQPDPLTLANSKLLDAANEAGGKDPSNNKAEEQAAQAFNEINGCTTQDPAAAPAAAGEADQNYHDITGHAPPQASGGSAQASGGSAQASGGSAQATAQGTHALSQGGNMQQAVNLAPASAAATASFPHLPPQSFTSHFFPSSHGGDANAGLGGMDMGGNMEGRIESMLARMGISFSKGKVDGKAWSQTFQAVAHHSRLK